MTQIGGGKGDHDLPWFIIGRWKEYEGEQRANLLRLIGIAAFYTIELINRHGLHLGFLDMPRVESVDERFHMAVTALAVAWANEKDAQAVATFRHNFPDNNCIHKPIEEEVTVHCRGLRSEDCATTLAGIIHEAEFFCRNTHDQ
ncbi:MAG: hypothetical protein IH899_10530 [Planctomycetes bacterium]|nr:hypothetical protein [Planctomycetota bacterium]